jgi:hypothetical protein
LVFGPAASTRAYTCGVAVLALSLAVATATTAVAAAAPPIMSPEEVAQRKALYRVGAGAQPHPTRAAAIEDQNDRLPRNQRAALAGRTQAAVTLARSLSATSRRFPPSTSLPHSPACGPSRPRPGAAVDMLATLLLGLVGGLVGGGAAIGGWILATRRRGRRVAAAT